MSEFIKTSFDEINVYEIGVECEHYFEDGKYIGVQWKQGGILMSDYFEPATKGEYEKSKHT